MNRKSPIVITMLQAFLAGAGVMSGIWAATEGRWAGYIIIAIWLVFLYFQVRILFSEIAMREYRVRQEEIQRSLDFAAEIKDALYRKREDQ